MFVRHGPFVRQGGEGVQKSPTSTKKHSTVPHLARERVGQERGVKHRYAWEGGWDRGQWGYIDRMALEMGV